MSPNYDVIVLGTGGVGSAAVYALAQRGASVLGIDLHPPGHDRGSSHGQTRVIRQAYFEHPDYVPLAIAAYDLWHALEAAVSQTLMIQTGLLQAGPPDGAVVRGVLAAAQQHDLQIDRIAAEEANERFAPLQFASDHTVLWEACAGYLRVEDCVQAHLAAALRCGATLVHGQRIVDWTSDQHGVRVQTDSQSYQARKLILALGAGSHPLWKLPWPITVLKKHQYWFTPAASDDGRLDHIPIYLVETGNEVFYGFPRISERGLKVARHTGGEVIAENPLLDDVPEHQQAQQADQALVESFLAQLIPEMRFARQSHSVCWYSMTSDGHFYLGRHPDLENVCVATGLSGHGFKFTPVLGAALANLTLDGRTAYPTEFLDLVGVRQTSGVRGVVNPERNRRKTATRKSDTR